MRNFTICTLQQTLTGWSNEEEKNSGTMARTGKTRNSYQNIVEIRKFIILFVTARHFSLSWARQIQFTLLFKIHFNIIIHLCLGFPSLPFPLGIPTKQPVCTSILSHARHMHCPSHHSWFDYPYDIGKDYISWSSPLWNFLLTLLTSSLLGPHIFSIMFWTLSVYDLPSMQETKFHTHT